MKRWFMYITLFLVSVGCAGKVLRSPDVIIYAEAMIEETRLFQVKMNNKCFLILFDKECRNGVVEIDCP